jgi:hypothetical protein
MSATNRNDGAFKFYILEKRCDHKERMVFIYHEHLKLALCLQICVTSIYTGEDQPRSLLLRHLCLYSKCTQSCEINVFKKFCHLCNKLDTKERIEGFDFWGR